MKKKNVRRGLAIVLALLLACNAFLDYSVSARAAKDAQNITAEESGGQNAKETSGDDSAVALADEGNTSGEVLDGDQTGFHVNKFEIKVNGKPLGEGDTVYAGAEVEVGFEWYLDNDVTAPSPWEGSATYTIDTNSGQFKNSGIDFSQMPSGTPDNPMDLIQDGKVVGKCYMENGVISIIIQDQSFFDNTHSRYGGVYFKGTIAKDPDKTKDGQKKQIEFGTKSTTVTYYESENPSEASVWKYADGRITSKNGKYYQTFKVEVQAKYGKVTHISLQDSVFPKNGLTNVQGCKITGSSVDGLNEGATYSSLEELFAAIESATFYAGEKVTFEYTVEVSSDIFDPNQSAYSNTIEGTYQSNRDTRKKDLWPTKAEVQVTKPTISKSATKYEDGKVGWTITVNLGDRYEQGKNSLSDYLSSITDIPGVGLLEEGVRKSLVLGNFVQTPGKPEEFTYTYETEVTDAVKGSATDETVHNSVEMVTKDGHTQKRDTSYTIKQNGVTLEKSYYTTYFDGDQQIVVWNIAISGLTEGINTLHLYDYADIWNGAKHQLLDYLWIDDNVVREEGTFKNNSTPVIVDEEKTKFYIYEDQSNFDLYFNDNYVKSAAAQNKTINIQVKTQLLDPAKREDGTLSVFINKVRGSYTSDSSGTEQGLPEVQASYADTQHLLTKKGTTHAEAPYRDIKGHEVEYVITVPLQHLEILATGETFSIYDILDSRMKYVTDSLSVTLDDPWGNQQYDFEKSDYALEQSSVNEDNTRKQKLQFTVTIRSGLKEKMLEAQEKGWLLAIHYKAEYKDLSGLLKDEDAGKDITNNAGGNYNGNSIGSSSVTDDLEPDAIITKSADYSSATAPYIKYTVELNKDALTLLSAGGMLDAEDSFDDNSAVILVDVENPRFGLDAQGKEKYKVRVYSYEVVAVWGDWPQYEWVELGESQFSYSFEGERKVKFKLPDSKYLRVEYYGYTVAQPGTVMDESNSTNTFKLSGYESDATEGRHFFDNRTVENYAWVASQPGSIILYKYWRDEKSQQIALNGSVFKIVKVNYDEERQEWVEGDVLRNNIRITEANKLEDGKIQIDGLPLRQLLALYEVEADKEYAVNKKPYYFYIKDKDDTAVPTNFPDGTHEFENDTASEVEYPNFKAASLQLEKTIEGDVTRAEAEGALEFTVTDSDGELVGTYHLSDFKYDAASDKWILLLDRLMPGRYTVEETVYDIDGKPATSVKYSIDNGETWSSQQEDAKDTQVQVELGEKESATITYKNVYPGAFPVKISKRGLTGAEEIPGARFRITGGSYGTTGFEWTSGTKARELQLVPGDYELTETLAPKGYVLEKRTVKFKVSPEGTIEIISTDVGELDGDNTVVMRDDTFDVEVSKIELGGSEEVPDAQIALYDKEDLDKDYKLLPGKAALYTWTSEKGKSESIGKYLYAGRTYVLEETQAPKGYGYSEKIEFQVTEDGKISNVKYVGSGKNVKTENNKILMEDKVISVKLSKVDYEDRITVLPGAKLGLFKASDVDEDGKPKIDPEKAEHTWTSQSDPEELGGYLEAGEEYALVELEPPSGYGLADTIYFNVNKDGTVDVLGDVDVDETDSVILIRMADVANDDEVASLEIRKTVGGELTIDEINGDLTFTVESTEGVDPPYREIFTIKEHFRKNSSGDAWVLRLLPLPLGKYKVTESHNTIDGMNCTVTYTIDNRPEQTGDTADGIELTQDRSQHTIVFNNNYQPQKGKIKLTKSFESSADALKWSDIAPYLKFHIYRVSEGEKTEIEGSPISGDAPGQWTPVSGQDNAYECELDVQIGSYIVEEKYEPNDGTYNPMDDYDMTVTYKVTVESSTPPELKVDENATTSVEIHNTYVRSYLVPISKRAINGTDELEGAKLTISGKPDDGSTFENVTWTSDGKEACQFRLKPGEYTLTETIAPRGHKLAKEKVTFRVESDGSITIKSGPGDQVDGTVVMRDAPLDVEVNKVVLNGSQEVPGATLVLYNDKRVELGRHVSEVGKVWEIGQYLQLGGKYVLVEELAPEGYGYSANISFEVNNDGKIINVNNGRTGKTSEGTTGNRILMDDKAISIKLNKVDLGGEEIPGAVISIYRAEDVDDSGQLKDKNTKPLDSWESKIGETHDFGKKLKLSADNAEQEYVLIENSAPRGYEIASSIRFKVKKDGTVEVLSQNVKTAQGGVYLMEDSPFTGDESADLVLTKSVDVNPGEGLDPADITKTNLRFRVEGIDLEKPYENVFFVGNAGFGWNNTEKKYIQYIYNLEPGKYEVTELWDDPESSGVVCAGQTWEMVLTSSSGKGLTKGNGVTTGSFELKNEDVVEVNFTNTYERAGTLVITKTIEGAVTKEEAEGTLKFIVTDNATKKSETYTLKDDFDYDEETKTWSKELIEAAGGYTVQESVTASTGITYTAKYTLNGGTSKSSKKSGDVVEVKQGGTTTVAYTNTYSTKSSSSGKGSKGGSGGSSGGGGSDDTSVLAVVASTVTAALTQTGDSVPLGMWVVLFVCGGAGVIVSGVAMKRRRKKN